MSHPWDGDQHLNCAGEVPCLQAKWQQPQHKHEQAFALREAQHLLVTSGSPAGRDLKTALGSEMGSVPHYSDFSPAWADASASPFQAQNAPLRFFPAFYRCGAARWVLITLVWWLHGLSPLPSLFQEWNTPSLSTGHSLAFISLGEKPLFHVFCVCYIDPYIKKYLVGLLEIWPLTNSLFCKPLLSTYYMLALTGHFWYTSENKKPQAHVPLKHLPFCAFIIASFLLYLACFIIFLASLVECFFLIYLQRYLRLWLCFWL